MSTASALDDRGGTFAGGTGTSVDGRRWSGCGPRKGKDPPPRRGNGRLDQTFFRAGIGFRFFSCLLFPMFLICFECLAVTIKVISRRSPCVCANGRSGCLAVFSLCGMKNDAQLWLMDNVWILCCDQS